MKWLPLRWSSGANVDFRFDPARPETFTKQTAHTTKQKWVFKMFAAKYVKFGTYIILMSIQVCSGQPIVEALS